MAEVESAGESGTGQVTGVDQQALDEVVRFTSELIRIDTSNAGDGACQERPAAEYVAERLAGAGLTPTLLERSKGRTNVVARIEGTDPRPMPCWCTAISMWCPPSPPTGVCTPSPGRSATVWSGVAAPST